MCSQGRE